MMWSQKDWVRWWQSSDLKRPFYIQGPLKLLSVLYRIGQYLHRHCSLCLLKRASIPVISIGSVCAGGSGKTPLCAWLYDNLQPHLRCAIVMRGYNLGLAVEKPYWVEATSQKVADEAWMLSGLHQGKQLHRRVLISKNRWQGCQQAAQEGYQLALLDDGMQHYQLARDFEIVLFDPEDAFQGMLPEGRRREPWSALQRADWIIIRSSDPIAPTLKKNLGINEKKCARFSYGVGGWKGRELAFSSSGALAATRLGVCTGIARPYQFLKLLASHHIVAIKETLLADHEDVDSTFLIDCERQWKSHGIEYGICTEKDYARWSQVMPLSNFWIYPQLILNWHEGEEAFLNDLFSMLSLSTH